MGAANGLPQAGDPAAEGRARGGGRARRWLSEMKWEPVEEGEGDQVRSLRARPQGCSLEPTCERCRLAQSAVVRGREGPGQHCTEG